MRKKSFVLALVAGAVTSLAVATPASASSIAWGACPADATAPGLQCASIDVPLDYKHPDAAKIQVEISRLPSTNPAKRRGVLLFNPGGPGGPGLIFPAELAENAMPTSLRDEYDLIGFDPRGIGHSTPLTCDLTPAQRVGGNVPPYAQDAADVAKRADAVKQIAQQCGASKTAAELPYVTTANTARDMDAIRAALGEQKISYYGVSYGTYLGSVYSTLFPERTDRVVLDSVVGPYGLDIDASRLFGEGMQIRFPDFAKWAAARSSYGLGSTPAQVTATYFKLAAQLDRKPVAGIDGSLFRALTFSFLYSTNEFPFLAEAWQALLNGQVPTLPQAPAGDDSDNQQAAQLAVVCGDNAWPSSVSRYQHNVAVDRVRHPMFGAAAANIWPCAFWPTSPIEPPVAINDHGPSNILMVENLRDPATPLPGALQTRRRLGDRARMVTVDQGGHGVWSPVLNGCGYNAVSAFLADGTRPAHDSACGPEAAAVRLTPAQQQAAERMQARFCRESSSRMTHIPSSGG